MMLAIFGVVVVLVAAALIGTRLTADRGPDRGTGVTVGDVHADRIRIRVNGVRSAEVVPLRAGDLINLHADVTTQGAGALWIRTELDLSGIDADLAPYLSIYSGLLPSGVALKAAMDITDPITFPGYVGTAEERRPVPSQPFLLNGVSEQVGEGISPYPLAVAVYVDPKIPERLLARTFGLTAIVQTAPYQSHPEPPADDQWVDGPRLPLG